MKSGDDEHIMLSGWLGPAQSWARRANWALDIVALVFIGFLTFATVYEVVVRYFFNAPTIWSLELTQYAMLISLFAAAAYTLEVDGHVKADFFVTMMSPAKQRIAKMAGCIICAVFFVFLLKETWVVFWNTLVYWERSNSILGIPLAPIYVILPIGSFLMIVESIIKFAELVKKGTEVS